MFKKISLFLIFSFILCFSGYSFWIWSPKTKKWKNPKYATKATPFLQFKEAENFFKKKKYKRAYKEFKSLVIYFPDSYEAAEAQYYLGRCLEEMKKPYQAWQEYEKVVEHYPNSKHISEIIKRQYNIGDSLLKLPLKRVMGFSVYDFTEHPTIQIFNTLIDKFPHSPYAPQAQYKLGLLFLRLHRPDEAREAFGKVIDNYPDSEWASASRYQLGLAISRTFAGPDYDPTALKEAKENLEEFIKKNPEADISDKAKKHFQKLREEEARKYFDIAEFYLKQNKVKSAKIYYELVIKNYSDTSYAASAKEKLNNIKEAK